MKAASKDAALAEYGLRWGAPPPSDALFEVLATNAPFLSVRIPAQDIP